MLKTILHKGDLISLNVLFDAYVITNNEKEVLKTAGKLYKRSEELGKDRLIEITKQVYDIINNIRATYKNILNEIEVLIYHGDFKQVRFLKDYLEKFSFNSIELITKLIEDMKIGYTFFNECNHKKTSLFIILNICDFFRYICELSFSEVERKNTIEATKKQYEILLQDIKNYKIACTNPSSLTSYYHYSLFLYDIIGDRMTAIKILKEKHQEIILSLDETFDKYSDSYDIINKLTETLTNWVIDNNYGGINNMNS